MESGGQLWIQVDLNLNLTLALDCLVTGHHWPPLSHLSSFCTVGKRVGPYSRTLPFSPQEKPSPGERPSLSQQRRHQSWSTFKSMTLGSLPPKPRERLALHRAAAWEPTEPPDGDFQTEV